MRRLFLGLVLIAVTAQATPTPTPCRKIIIPIAKQAWHPESKRPNFMETSHGEIKVGLYDPTPTPIPGRLAVVEKYISELDTDIPKDVIRAIAWQETLWRQYDKTGMTFYGDHGEVGIMQISLEQFYYHPSWSYGRACRDTRYNLELGCKVLKEKMDWIMKLKDQGNWVGLGRKFGILGHTDLEAAISAYNGICSSQKYLKAIKRHIRTKPWKT